MVRDIFHLMILCTLIVLLWAVWHADKYGALPAVPAALHSWQQPVEQPAAQYKRPPYSWQR